ncbi:HalOD1 output domain-containing protein [Haloplanus aerogenes]|uniref:HalOD1 output domain-containing protein n=1 Tax=Haloplanus aerogenes TaxID=660522 RepID=UPI00131427C9
MNNTHEFAITCSEVGQATQTTHKTKPGPPSHAVIQTIAEIEDTDPTLIEPLYTAIDLDVLDQLFQRPHQSKSQSRVAVSFSYKRYHMRVTRASTVTDHEDSTHLPP